MSRSKRERAFLMNMFGGGAGVTWLGRFEFATDAAAPLSSPYTENGVSLTLVQTDGQFSKSGGALVFPAQTTAAWGDQGFYGPAVTRAAGVALIAQVRLTTIAQGLVIPTWFTGAALNTPNFNSGQEIGLGPSNAGIFEQVSGIVIGPVFATNTTYTIAIVLHSVGAEMFVKGGVYTNWTRVWVQPTGTTATLYPGMSNYNNAGSVLSFGWRQLPAPFSSDYGLATLHQVNPVANTEYEGEADGIFDCTLTLPAGWGAGDVFGFAYRYVNADNYWSVWSQGDVGSLNLTSRVGGTSTQRITVAGVFSAGQTYTIRVISQGSKHNVYTLNGTTWTKRGAEVDLVTAMDAEKTAKIEISGTHAPTLSALDAWPRTLSAALATELERT